MVPPGVHLAEHFSQAVVNEWGPQNAGSLCWLPQKLQNPLLGLDAHQGTGGFSVPDGDQSGDAHNPKLGSQSIFCVYVHLSHPDFRMLGGKLLHNGAIMRQGPHQEAQKSRRTGTGEASTSC